MLRRLRVKNYKSLRNLDLRLNDLNVLVGPNAAGKSNILDCLAFLSEQARGKGEEAWKRRGGFADMAWGGDPSRSIEVVCDLQLPAQVPSATYSYTLTMAAEEQGRIQRESITRGDSTVIISRESFDIHYSRGGISAQSSYQSCLSSIPSEEPEAQAVAANIASWAVYDFQKARIATSQPVRRETRLAPDGTNAATVLHYLHNAEVEAFERIESLLKDAIPEVDRLLTPPDPREDGQTYIAFREKHVPGIIPAWNISEGSARLVVTLLALLAPPPPSLVGIEAPETALHPYLCEYLVDILKLGARHTQVLITTHSPYLLDHLPPESIIIVSKGKGETSAKRVARTKGLREALKTLGLGDIWRAGHLGGVP